MQFSYSQNPITPNPYEYPVYLAGFGNNRQAIDVHDDLFARVLVLYSDEITLALCALDLIGFFRADALEVAERVRSSLEGKTIRNLHVIVASTHTHHGPDTMGLWGPNYKTSGVNQAYLESLKDKIIATIRIALKKSILLGAMKMTTVHVPGVAKNTRNPEIVDDELALLQLLDAKHKPLVTLFNFPCHPEVLWEHNPHISADYPGFLRNEVEKLTGAPCIFFSADLGGMMTPDVRDHSFEEAEAMGKTLVHAGLEALAKADPVPPSTVHLQKKEFRIKLTNILFKLAFRRKLLPEVRDDQGCVSTEANLLKIGPAWFATVPGELLPELGMILKADMRASGAGSAGIIGLANDELGYILPPEQFHYPLNPFKPGRHYEETMSISREMAPTVLTAIQDLLRA